MGGKRAKFSLDKILSCVSAADRGWFLDHANNEANGKESLKLLIPAQPQQNPPVPLEPRAEDENPINMATAKGDVVIARRIINKIFREVLGLGVGVEPIRFDHLINDANGCEITPPNPIYVTIDGSNQLSTLFEYCFEDCLNVFCNDFGVFGIVLRILF
jgi:hypothetical protein